MTAVPGGGDFTPAVIASGGGYRAIIKSNDQVIWWCPHVHFTEHSAEHCPARARRLAELS